MTRPGTVPPGWTAVWALETGWAQLSREVDRLGLPGALPLAILREDVPRPEGGWNRKRGRVRVLLPNDLARIANAIRNADPLGRPLDGLHLLARLLAHVPRGALSVLLTTSTLSATLAALPKGP